jgi:hypothetical protein
VAGFDETFNVPTHSFNIEDYSTWMYGPGDVGTTFTVTVEVDDNDGGVDSDSFDLTVVEDTLRVIDFELNASGFDVTFSRAPNLSDLNLYDSLLDGSPSVLEAPDVTLIRNGSEQILGSIVWAADTNTLSFVKTGGVLAVGSYDITLISDALGFHDGLNLLDGDGDFNDGEVNDDYTNSFVVGAPPVDNRVVSIGDFARGAGQDVNVPTVEMGGLHLPIFISSATSVQSVDVDILYNPMLLSITSASLGAAPTVAGGWSITQNSISIDATHTLLKITISGINALSGSNVEIIKLNADVPSTAPYGDSQVIRLQGLRVNEDLIPSQADFAIHKAIYVGDADGSGLYGGGDSALISRVVVALDSGFDAHDWTDPRIVGDASGDGTLSGLDASYIAQEAVAIDRPEVPPLPGVSLVHVGGGIDPQYSIDENIPAPRGGSVTVPVKLEVLPGETNAVGGTFVLTYDDDLLTYESNSAAAGAGWTILFVNDTQPGFVRVSYQTTDLDPAAVGQSLLANLDFSVSNLVTISSTSLLDIEAADPNELGLTWTDLDGSLVFTGLIGDYNLNGVVDSPDYVFWRKTLGSSVPNFSGADGDGDGTVDQDDYDLWKMNFGMTAPGSGFGAGYTSSASEAASKATTPTAASSFTGSVAAPLPLLELASAVASVTVADISGDDTSASVATMTVRQSARDEALADLTLPSPLLSAGQLHRIRSSVLGSRNMGASSTPPDALLIDLAIATKRERQDDRQECIADARHDDDVESIDDLFAELEEAELMKLSL